MMPAWALNLRSFALMMQGKPGRISIKWMHFLPAKASLTYDSKKMKSGFVLAEFSYDAATTDGGINWGLTHDTDTSGLPFLYGIYNTLDGFEDMYLAGQYGTLLKWKKDSSEWQDVSGRLCSWINDISFSSGSHGWIASGTGILKTIDGGQNWNSVASPLLNMKVIDGVNDSLIISSDANNIYRSINGGQSWSTVYSGSDTSMNARDIRMIDETTGYIFSFTGNYFCCPPVQSVWKTTDGGINWQKHIVAIGNAGVHWAMQFLNANEGWVSRGGADSNVLYHSVDGGITWPIKYETSGLLYQFLDVFFLDSQHGYLVTSGSNYYETSDGGLT